MTNRSKKNLLFTFRKKTEEDSHCICFSDKATYHVSGKLNKDNARIWGNKNPLITKEIERDRPKVNMWCGLLCNKVI